MFDLTEQDVFRLTEFFAESDLEYLHITAKDVEIVLARGDGAVGAAHAMGAPGAAATPAAAPHAPVVMPQVGPAMVPPTVVDSAPAATVPGPAANPGPHDDAGDTVVIAAPSVGVFYRAPSPDQPHYVEVGDSVEPETTVALIEAMKVFAGVTAGVKGTVVEVLADNNALVEHGQPLFRVAPTG